VGVSLHERLRWADAVICVVTPAYLGSLWCSAEVGIALARGSRVLPVRAKPEVVHPLLRSLQHADLTVYLGAAQRATPKTKALLLERIAWADARSGDLRSCERSLDAVNDSFSRGPRENDPDWVYWLNRDEIDIMAGRCYTELKLPRRSEPLLREAISRYDNTLTRENILYLSWLAESYIELNDIDEAASVTLQAAQLVAQSGSVRADIRLWHIARRLESYRSVSTVAEFLDVYLG
jgi:TIR domain